MAKNIEPTLKLISEYLKLKKSENFVIPEYQRSYSWDISQCDKLWQDIESFIDSDGEDPYFFGTIIVDCSETNKLNLIDGQQRTTTFLLLLKALLLRLKEVIQRMPDDDQSIALKAGLIDRRNKVMEILYKAEAEDIPEMLHDNSKIKNILILENRSINELYRDEVKKIVEASDIVTAEKEVEKIPRKQKDNKYTNHFRNFKYFYEKLGDYDSSELNVFSKKFLQECQVIEIRSWQIEQAITMFNSLNSTGLPLSDADIISAQLYSNAGDVKDCFIEKWEAIKALTNELSYRKITDIDGVLQQYMYIHRAESKEYLKIKVDGTQEVSVDVTTPGLRRFYIDIKKDLLKEPLPFCNNKLLPVAERWDRVKDYPIVKLLLKYNENAKLFLASYLYRYEADEITEEKISEVCECLLRLFTVLELSAAGYSSTNFKTFLFKENIKLVDKCISVEEIKNDFKQQIENHWKREELKEAILDYNKNLLVFLNEYIYAKNKGLEFDFSESVNIEHIMPASGRNIVSIRQDAGINNSNDSEARKEFAAIVNKLGNKILLEENINKSVSNQWFKTKKQTSVQNKSGYKNSKFGLASALLGFPRDEWTSQDIYEKTDVAADRIIKFIFDMK